MAVKVRFPGGFEATVENYRWRSSDARLEEMLNALVNPAGPSGDDPDPDHTAALSAVDKLGAEIVEADEADDEPDGRIY